MLLINHHLGAAAVAVLQYDVGWLVCVSNLERSCDVQLIVLPGVQSRVLHFSLLFSSFGIISHNTTRNENVQASRACQSIFFCYD
jgi:hypothetical protein